MAANVIFRHDAREATAGAPPHQNATVAVLLAGGVDFSVGASINPPTALRFIHAKSPI